MSSNETVAPDASKNVAGISAAKEKDLFLKILSPALIISSLAMLAWAIGGDSFKDAERIVSARFCLPFSAGLALMLIGFSIDSRLKNFAFWAALCLIGQAASLQMIDAGRRIHFQHYRPIADLLRDDAPALALLVLQIVLVLYGLASRRRELKKRIGSTFKSWRLIAAAAFLLAAGAAPTPDFSIYATDVLLAGIVQTVNLGNVVLLALSFPDESLGWLKEKIKIVFRESVTAAKPGLDKFSLIAALWTFSLAAGLSLFVYQRHPHVPDEVQYLFQAKYFAAGQLTAKAPPVPEAFAMYMTPHAEERWFSIFPPGWAALLAVGEKLNAAWLVNPLLGGVCILLAYLFFQGLYSVKFARLAILLLACSPWFVFMTMSFMSHTAALAFALAAAVALQAGFRTRGICYFFASGLSIGLLSLIRPLDAAIVAVLLGFWTLFESRSRRASFVNGFFLATGTMATAALILPYNRAVTGDALLSPMDFYYTKYFWADVMSLGFGANRGISWGLDAFPGHSPFEAFVNAVLNVFSINIELFGWASGSLVLAAVFLFFGTLRKKDFWMIAASASVAGAYSLYWYHGGPDFGARYWFPAIVPLVALTARGVEFLSAEFNENKESNLHPRVVLAVAALGVVCLVNYLPWRALDKYYRYLEMKPGVERLARENNFGESLVLVRGSNHPDYQSAWIYNPLNFEGVAPIYAWDADRETRVRLLKAYPDRPIWTVEAGGDFRVVRGPVSAAQLLAEETP